MPLISLLTVNSNSRHANTLSTNIYYPLNSNGQRAFSYYAPKLWNALPLNVRNIELLPEFKAKLKTHLFSHFDELMARFNMYRNRNRRGLATTSISQKSKNLSNICSAVVTV